MNPPPLVLETDQNISTIDRDDRLRWSPINVWKANVLNVYILWNHIYVLWNHIYVLWNHIYVLWNHLKMILAYMKSNILYHLTAHIISNLYCWSKEMWSFANNLISLKPVASLTANTLITFYNAHPIYEFIKYYKYINSKSSSKLEKKTCHCGLWDGICLHFVHTAMKVIFTLFSVVMKLVLHPIVTAMAMEKIGNHGNRW